MKMRHKKSNILTALTAFWMFYTSTRKPSDRELKRKKENRIQSISCFCPPSFSPKCGMSHNFQRYRTLIYEDALAYQCSPFCSSVAYSQDGKSIQIHPSGSHNPAHNRHCSHCIHLYLRKRENYYHNYRVRFSNTSMSKHSHLSAYLAQQKLSTCVLRSSYYA